MFSINLSLDKANRLKSGKPVEVRINGQMETLTLRKKGGDCLCWRDQVRRVLLAMDDSIDGEPCKTFMCE